MERGSNWLLKASKILLPISSVDGSSNPPPELTEAHSCVSISRADFNIQLFEVEMGFESLEGTCRADSRAAGYARRKWAKLNREKAAKDRKEIIEIAPSTSVYKPPIGFWISPTNTAMADHPAMLSNRGDLSPCSLSWTRPRFRMFGKMLSGQLHRLQSNDIPLPHHASFAI